MRWHQNIRCPLPNEYRVSPMCLFLKRIILFSRIATNYNAAFSSIWLVIELGFHFSVCLSCLLATPESLSHASIAPKRKEAWPTIADQFRTRTTLCTYVCTCATVWFVVQKSQCKFSRYLIVICCLLLTFVFVGQMWHTSMHVRHRMHAARCTINTHRPIGWMDDDEPEDML